MKKRFIFYATLIVIVAGITCYFAFNKPSPTGLATGTIRGDEAKRQYAGYPDFSLEDEKLIETLLAGARKRLKVPLETRKDPYYLPLYSYLTIPEEGIPANLIRKLKKQAEENISVIPLNLIVQAYLGYADSFLSFCDANNITVKERINNQAFIVNVPFNLQLLEKLESESSIRWLNKLQPVDKMDIYLAGGAVPIWAKIRPGEAKLILIYDQATPKQALEQLVNGLGGVVLRFSRLINACDVVTPVNKLEDLASSDLVEYIEAFPPPPKPNNDGARESTNVDEVTDSSGSYGPSGAGLTGTDIVVMVYDGGAVLETHDDLTGRITIAETDGDYDDHATHVAGTLGGDGTASGGTYAGMATECDIVSYSYDYLGGSTDTLEDEFTDAIDPAIYDSDIISNSWGSGDPSYSSNSAIIDTLCRDNNVVITWSAGNDRKTVDPYGSIYGNGQQAKNVIIVGAITDDDEMTSFSGWGPKWEYSLAPIVVAPGYEITSTFTDSDSSYFENSGTSMSTPCVAGICALLLEQFDITYGAAPSYSSTIRAIIANTATDLGNYGPDYKFGFGKVNAELAVNTVIDGDFFEDGSSMTTAGDSWEDTYNVSSTAVGDTVTGLKILLAWDDPAGSPSSRSINYMVNDLDLTLESPSGKVYEPLTLDPEDPTAIAAYAADSYNNLEQIVVPYPEDGDWTITVTGTFIDTAEGVQPFSVAACVTTDPVTLVVPLEYATLADAADAARSGDTIFLQAGTYNETGITLPEGVILKGESADLAVIDGEDSTSAVGLTLEDGCVVQGVHFAWFNQAVIADTGAAVTVQNCNITNNETGIYGSSGSELTIVNNTILENTTGIYLEGDSTLYNNIIAFNTQGLDYTGSITITADYNDYYDNTGDAAAGYSFGSNTLYEDPAFIDYTDDGYYGNDDLALLAESTLRCAGNPDSEYNNKDDTRNNLGSYGGPEGKLFLPTARTMGDVATQLGKKIIVYECETVSSDPDGLAIDLYTWSFTSVPSSSSLTSADIADADTTIASFDPDAEGEYVLTLVVENTEAIASPPAEVTVTIRTADPIYVEQDGSGDYLTIAEGIEAAAAGDIIYVGAGTYSESALEITKSLTIVGEGWDSTIIDGGGETYIFNINSAADDDYNADYTHIEGFTLKEAEYLIWTNACRVIIQRNLLELNNDDEYGVYQDRDEDYVITTLRNNVFSDPTAGNTACYSENKDIYIYNNIFDGPRMALRMSDGTYFYSNIMQNCNKAFAGAPGEDNDAVFNDYYKVSVTTMINEYYDLTDDPDFSTSGTTGYELNTSSPCVDAGVPLADLADADGTDADIGVFGGPAGDFSAEYTDWIDIAELELNLPVILDISYSPSGTIYKNDTLTFDSGAYDIEGESLTYLWDFDDGTTSTSETVDHAFTAEGTYTVEVTVGDGYTDTTDTLSITVYNRAPVAAMVPLKSLENVGVPIIFDAMISTDDDGDTLTYSWNFGDGHTSTDAVTSHSYTATGIYHVMLTVSDGSLTDTTTTTIRIIRPVTTTTPSPGGKITHPGFKL